MRRFDFPPNLLAEINRDRFKHPDPHVQCRREILLLKAHGQSHAMIAKLAGVLRPTVQRVLDAYKGRKLEKIRTFH